MPSTPIAMSSFAKNETLRSSFFHVSAPTSVVCLSRAFTSAPKARRNDGDDVERIKESSVSSLRDRVERFDDPIKVMNGLLGVLLGDSQIPAELVRDLAR